ncbi:metallophosphoesterase [Myxococcaceae bacterium JPH2]|nr:metallophosphoesterase [Myxococcaceae bacterium JPH2]
MTFAIIHLSDIHLSEKGNLISGKGQKIARAIQPQIEGVCDLVIIASGDVAYSGKETEYAEAKRLFSDICSEIRSQKQNISIHSFAVPGNHDCDFSKPSTLRDTLINQLKQSDTAHEAPQEIIEPCLVVQSAFWDFEKSISGRSRSATEQAGYLDTISLGSHKVELLGLNSAWLSTKREQPGTLAAPQKSINTPQNNADFRIAFIHHPANWQAPGSARAFRDSLLDNVDMLLVGHEHASDITEIGRPSGTSALIIDAPALQSDGQRSGFSLLKISLNSKTLTRVTFTWKGTTGSYQASRSDPIRLERIGKAAHSNAKPRKAFLSDLRDIGANFTHPRAESLHLEDLFVWPDIAIRSFRRLVKGTAIAYSGDQSHQKLRTFKKQVIEGTERSGRTSIAKSLALDFIADGITALLIDGASVRATSADELLVFCENICTKQYDGIELEALRQNDPGRIALIIDNFDSSPLPVSKLLNLLNAAAQLFGRVIAFVSDLFNIQEIFSHEELPALLDFQHIVVSELGHRSRRELIEQWYRIGSDLLADESAFERKVSESERYVSNHVGRGIFPSYPICVLTLLQARDAGTNTDLSAGAYGAIYEVLLYSALNRNANHIPIDFLQTFLAELAIHMLRRGSREMPEGELDRVALLFMKSTLTEFSIDDIRLSLTNARMLIVRDGNVRFRYSHIYYLSCAKALQIYKQDPDRRADASLEINRLFSTLHTDASSNIVMFYLHFSRDLESITRLVDVADRLFADQSAANLESVDFGGKAPWSKELLAEIEADQQEGIRQYRTEQDDVERFRDALHAEDNEILDQINNYHTCIKALQLIGQVVRSFPGLLPRELKLRAVRSLLNLSLRTVSHFAGAVRTTRDDLREAIAHYLTTTKRVANLAETKERADDAIFQLALAVGHGLVRRTATALGSSHIFPALDVLRADGLGVGFDLIEFAVRLDHEKDRAEVKSAVALQNRLSSSFSTFIMRQIVIDYLRAQRLPPGLRASFANAFNIKVKPRSLGEGGVVILESSNTSGRS